MRIEMRKFGTLLNGRTSGTEAALRLFQIVNSAEDNKTITLDFDGVEILTPSFADELISQTKKRYKDSKKLKFDNIETTVVKDTLRAIGAIK